jgi:hypothetical protein
MTWSFLSKNGADTQGFGGLFQAQTIYSEVVERHLIFCTYGSSPKEQVPQGEGPRMCLSGAPFVPKMEAVRAKESCGFELEKSPPNPWIRGKAKET